MSAKGTSMPQGHSGVLRHLACGFACASILSVAACDPASTPPKPASPTTYPDLASVPPRPVLADTLEQRREIQHELAAARNNAERRAAEVAYATGRAAEPPPPLPAPSAAPPAGAAPPRNRRAATARLPAPIWTVPSTTSATAASCASSCAGWAVRRPTRPARRPWPRPWAWPTRPLPPSRGALGSRNLRRPNPSGTICGACSDSARIAAIDPMPSARATGRAWRDSRSRRIVLGSAPTTVIAWTPA